MGAKPNFYKQTDARWSSHSHRTTDGGRTTIGASGCGPTCCSNVVTKLHHSSWKPVKFFDKACTAGLMTSNSGLYWSGIKTLLVWGGVKAENIEQTSSDAKAKEALKDGWWVINLQTAGLWTRGGHFILVYNYKNGYVDISDPASSASYRVHNTWTQLCKSAAQWWIIKDPKIKTLGKSASKSSTKLLMYAHGSDCVCYTKPSAKNANKAAKITNNTTLYVQEYNGKWYKIYKGKYKGKYIQFNKTSKYKSVVHTYKTKAVMNIRSGYTTKSKILGQVKKGKIVKCDKVRGSWAHFKKQTNIPISGWVCIKSGSTRYLTLIK